MTRYAVVKILDEETSPTWSEFYKRYLAHAATYKAETTMKCSESQSVRDFTSFIGNPKLNEITPERADAWHIDLASRLKPNTVRLRLSVIREAFEYAIEIDAISKNPFRHIKPPKYRRAGRVLTDQEIAALLDERDLSLWQT